MSTGFHDQNVSKVHGYCSASILNNHASESLKSLYVTAMIQSKNDVDVVKNNPIYKASISIYNIFRSKLNAQYESYYLFCKLTASFKLVSK